MTTIYLRHTTRAGPTRFSVFRRKTTCWYVRVSASFFFSFSKLDGNDLFLTYSQHSWLYTQRESIERERENVGGMKKQPKKNWRRSREIGSGFPLSFFCFCASCDWRRRSSLSTDGKPNFFFSDRRRRFSSVSLVDLFFYHSVVF
jgi:hypothetical protein